MASQNMVSQPFRRRMNTGSPCTLAQRLLIVPMRPSSPGSLEFKRSRPGTVRFRSEVHLFLQATTPEVPSACVRAPRTPLGVPNRHRKVSGLVEWVARSIRHDRCAGKTPQGDSKMSAAIPFALAGTGYGLIGILVIIVLVLVIWRLI